MGAAKTSKKPAAAKKTAAAKPAAAKRVLPKKSPLAGTTVDAYVAKLEPRQAQIIDQLRAIVREHAPEASEVIKWARPVFEQNGPMAFIQASKKHVTFGFWRGAELKAPAGLLEGDGDRMKHLKIAVTGEVRADVVGGLVRQAAALNKAKGDPTKRA